MLELEVVELELQELLVLQVLKLELERLSVELGLYRLGKLFSGSHKENQNCEARSSPPSWSDSPRAPLRRSASELDHN